jgi:hypothetical protein
MAGQANQKDLAEGQTGRTRRGSADGVVVLVVVPFSRLKTLAFGEVLFMMFHA